MDKKTFLKIYIFMFTQRYRLYQEASKKVESKRGKEISLIIEDFQKAVVTL